MLDAAHIVVADSLEEADRGVVLVASLILKVQEEGYKNGKSARGKGEEDEKAYLAKQSSSNKAG